MVSSTYNGFSMVQFDTTGQSPLGKRAQLGDDQLIGL